MNEGIIIKRDMPEGGIMDLVGKIGTVTLAVNGYINNFAYSAVAVIRYENLFYILVQPTRDHSWIKKTDYLVFLMDEAECDRYMVGSIVKKALAEKIISIYRGRKE